MDSTRRYILRFFSFCCQGNGYCRSEAAVVVLLTKRSAAKRVYATVLNAGNNTDGYKEQGERKEGAGLHCPQ